MEDLKEQFDQLVKMAGVLEEAKRMPKLKGGRREHNKLKGLVFGAKGVGYRLTDIQNDVKLLGKMGYIDNSVAKQVFRIFFVAVGCKVGKRQESVCRPFPNITKHLTATKRTVTIWKSTHINAAKGPGIQVGAVRCWRRVSPKIATLGGSKRSISGRHAQSSDLPLEFCR